MNRKVYCLIAKSCFIDSEHGTALKFVERALFRCYFLAGLLEQRKAFLLLKL